MITARIASAATLSAILATAAAAQFAENAAPETNLSAMLPAVGAHDSESRVFGDGAGALLILTLENRTLRAMYSSNSGSSFTAPYFVAGSPTGSYGVKSFEAVQVGSRIYLAYVSEGSPYGIGVRALTSLDLGQTWSLTTTIAEGNAASAPVRDLRMAAAGNVAAVLYLGNDGNDPFVSVSTDQGQTYLAPVRVDAGTTADRFWVQSASVAVTAAGVVCVAFAQDRVDHYWSAPTVYVTRSTNGVTFSAETAVTPPSHDTSLDVELRVANDGNVLLAFFEYPTTGTYKVYVYRSTNAGVSYGTSTNVSVVANYEAAPHLAISRSPSATVLLAYEEPGDGVRIHRSTNQGVSFGAGTLIVGTATTDTRLPLVPTAAGWIVGWTDVRADTYTGEHTDVYTRVSTDDGVTWKTEQAAGVNAFESRIQSIADAGDPGTGGRAYVSYLDGAADAGRSLDLNGARLVVSTGIFDFDRQDAGDSETARPRTNIGSAVAADGTGRVVTAFSAVSAGPYADVFTVASSDNAYTFAAPVRVASTAAGSRVAMEPRVASVAGGPVYLVYSSDNPGVGREVRFTRSLDGGATWEADIVLGTIAGYSSGVPEWEYPRAQMVASDTRVWVAWSTGANVYLSRSLDSGATFAAAVDVDQDSRGYNVLPSLCVSGNRAVIAYTGYNVAGSAYSVWAVVSDDSGDTWTTKAQLRSEAAAVGANTTIAICHPTQPPVVVFADFRSGNKAELRSAVYQGGGVWAADTSIPMSLSPSLGYFDAAYLANGNALVVFGDYVSGRVYRAGAFTPGAFTDLLALDSGSPNPAAWSYSPRIATAGNLVWVAWLEDTFGGGEMVVNRGFDDLTFTSIQRQDDVLPQGSRVGAVPWRPAGPTVVAEGNRLHLTWTSERVSGQQEAIYAIVDLDDNDRDHVANGSDCNDFDPGVFAAPTEVAGLQVSKMPATRLSWTSQAGSAGASTHYDVVQGSLSALRSSGGFGAATCLINDVPGTTFDDPNPDPSPGDGVYYLVRAQNSCASATYGDSSLLTDPRDALDSSLPCF